MKASNVVQNSVNEVPIAVLANEMMAPWKKSVLAVKMAE